MAFKRRTKFRKRRSKGASRWHGRKSRTTRRFVRGKRRFGRSTRLKRTVRGVAGVVKPAARRRRMSASTARITRVVKALLPTNRQHLVYRLIATTGATESSFTPIAAPGILYATDLAILARNPLGGTTETIRGRTNNRVRLDYLRMTSVWHNLSAIKPRYVRVMLFQRNNWLNYSGPTQANIIDNFFMSPESGSVLAWDSKSRSITSYINKFFWTTLYDRTFKVDICAQASNVPTQSFAMSGRGGAEKRITCNIPINKTIRFDIDALTDTGVFNSHPVYFGLGVAEDIGEGETFHPSFLFVDGYVYLHFTNLPDMLPGFAANY